MFNTASRYNYFVKYELKYGKNYNYLLRVLTPILFAYDINIINMRKLLLLDF